jgi:hypothetical protein
MRASSGTAVMYQYVSDSAADGVDSTITGDALVDCAQCGR